MSYKPSGRAGQFWVWVTFTLGAAMTKGNWFARARASFLLGQFSFDLLVDMGRPSVNYSAPSARVYSTVLNKSRSHIVWLVNTTKTTTLLELHTHRHSQFGESFSSLCGSTFNCSSVASRPRAGQTDGAGHTTRAHRSHQILSPSFTLPNTPEPITTDS